MKPTIGSAAEAQVEWPLHRGNSERPARERRAMRRNSSASTSEVVHSSEHSFRKMRSWVRHAR